MAWIESHQELAKHPKTRRVARMLGESIPSVLGRLHMLWWFALDYADDGDLGRFTDEDVADAMLWEGDPSLIVDALLGAGVTEGHGFLDRDEQGYLHIHDWQEYAGRLVEQRQKAKDRVRKWRNEHATRSEPGASDDVTHNVRATYDSTGPNRTGHDQTKPDRGSGAVADAPEPSAPKRKPKTQPSERKPPKDAEQFSALARIEGLDPCGPMPDDKRSLLNKRAGECAAQRWTGRAIEKIAELWAIEHPDGPACTANVVVMHGARLLAHPPRGPGISRNGRAGTNGSSVWKPLEVVARPNVMHADGTITDADGNLIGREGDALN